MIHELKTWPNFFQAVKDGRKPFEVRKNDRDFRVGDQLLLKEYQPEDRVVAGGKPGYTGDILHREITYVLKGGDFGISEEHVVLGLKLI